MNTETDNEVATVTDQDMQAVFGVGFFFGLVVALFVVWISYYLEYLPTGCAR